jgi:ferredoxin--NADP+ reductase
MIDEAYNARVVARTDLHDSLAILRVGREHGEVPRFEPGQFSNLGLLDDDPEPRLLRRAFSIASPASQRGHFEFYIQRVDRGAFTTRLWQLRPGDPLWLDPQVYGQFTLADVPPESDVLFVATGTGVGPFVSMLREYHGKRRWRSAAVIHSARTFADLGYHEELSALAARDATFRYVPTLTREPESSGWTGLRVRLQTLFEPARFRELFGRELTPEHSRVFICGNPEMIVQLSEQLAQHGFRPHRRKTPGHIHTERYW